MATASHMGSSMSTPEKSVPSPPSDAAVTVVAATESKAPRPQRYAESNHNLALLDPSRYGWTAAGDVVDLSEPHEVSFFMRLR